MESGNTTMRFAVVGPTYPFRGGIAHHTTLLVQHLSARHDVLFISFRRQYPRWLFPGRSDRDPSQQPVRADCVYLLDPLNPLTWYATARTILAFAPDGVIVPWWVPFWAPAWWTLGRMIRRRRKSRLLFLCHNVLPHESAFWNRWVARRVLQAGDGFVVQSEREAARLRDILPRGESAAIHVVLHPSYRALARESTMGREEARSLLKLPEETKAILFFGLVRPHKGVDLLIEALPALRERLPVHLFIVGEWWIPKEPLLARIAALGLDDTVTLVDRYVPNEALAQYFRAADVAVFPYRHATGSGAVQLALGFGLPIVAGDVDGVRELVDEAKGHVLVPPEDTDALAHALQRVLESAPEGSNREEGIEEETRDSWQAMVTAFEKMIANGRTTV